MILEQQIDIINGFLLSQSLEKVVLHDVLWLIGANPLHFYRWRPYWIYGAQVPRGLPTSWLRWFSKTLSPCLTLCKISKTWHKVHDFMEFLHSCSYQINLHCTTSFGLPVGRKYYLVDIFLKFTIFSKNYWFLWEISKTSIMMCNLLISIYKLLSNC